MKTCKKISVVSVCVLSCVLGGLAFAAASKIPGQGVVGSSIVLQDDGKMVSLVDPATNSSQKLGSVENLKAKTGIDLSAPGPTRVEIARDGMLPKVAQYLDEQGVKVEGSAGGAVGWSGRDKWQ